MTYKAPLVSSRSNRFWMDLKKLKIKGIKKIIYLNSITHLLSHQYFINIFRKSNHQNLHIDTLTN